MTFPLRIAVTGRSGQVARSLARTAEARGIPLATRGRSELDASSVDSVLDFFRACQPTLVVNAAAYTAVDKAESDADAAFAANAAVPALLATLCHYFKLPLVHYSTDYVFDGMNVQPYRETDPIDPLGVYGASKAAGEAAVRAICPAHVILRTAWVYAPGGSNFAGTMLRLGAERQSLGVVDDQRGSPTSATDIANATLDIAERIAAGAEDIWGTYHLTSAGETTWHGFAAEIFRLAAARGLKTPRLEPISTSQYPTPARRPAYSVLDTGSIESTFGIRLPAWQMSLARDFDDIIAQQHGAAK